MEIFISPFFLFKKMRENKVYGVMSLAQVKTVINSNRFNINNLLRA